MELLFTFQKLTTSSMPSTAILPVRAQHIITICHCKIYMRIPICKQRCGSHTANNGKDQEKYVMLIAMYEGKSVNV